MAWHRFALHIDDRGSILQIAGTVSALICQAFSQSVWDLPVTV